MAKVDYIYNPKTCRYEPVVVNSQIVLRRLSRFLSISFMIGVMALLVFNANYPSVDETLLISKNQSLKNDWEVLDKKLENADRALVALEQTDDHNYRVILDLEPLAQSVREAGVGGREKENASIQYLIIKKAYEKAEKIKNRLDIEIQSFEQLDKELAYKERMWASRPAIQPISNTDLTYLHTTYGMRQHPILGYWRPHRGLDFTAPKGSPIYATGDGVIEEAHYSTSFGNVVYIDHNFGFETRYAHMTEYIVKKGEKVKRGQIIGYVGNSGLSVATHLHYEILFKGDQINPINFFQRDLNNKEYEKLVELGGIATTSLD
ncbi:MAG TPA: M23 family metallopeptidase [Cyclobacteriaceae bacterium]|nr:M23 family metallopeptidase [Cyclobacteriaceae bacterium]HRK54231.1 M23 family metallopeptidase [Cyclobacteriaceae bacterium]